MKLVQSLPSPTVEDITTRFFTFLTPSCSVLHRRTTAVTRQAHSKYQTKNDSQQSHHHDLHILGWKTGERKLKLKLALTKQPSVRSREKHKLTHQRSTSETTGFQFQSFKKSVATDATPSSLSKDKRGKQALS